MIEPTSRDWEEIYHTLKELRESSITWLWSSRRSRLMILAETSDHVGSILQGLRISSKDLIREDSNAKYPELTYPASHLYDLKLHLDKSTHLLRQENGILTDIESMRLLEQAAFLESSIHYSLDEAIWSLDVFLFDQLSDSSHVVRPESLLAASRQHLKDGWRQLAGDNVIPTFAQLENCYEDVVVGKNLLRKLQRSYYGAQAETKLRQIVCLFEAPSLSRLGVRSNVLGCYSLVLSVCRLLNYLEVKGQRPLMQIEELRGDYRAITWTVELRIGLERLSMAVADLEPVFDLNGQNQGAADE